MLLFWLLRYISPSSTISRMTLTVFLITAIDSSLLLWMTFYRFPPLRQQILHIRLGWRLTFPSLWRFAVRRHSERRQECLAKKTGNGMVTRSEESITLMTPYHPSSFRAGVKNALWERREMGWWHGVKNLLHWWRLTAFLTTIADPSRSFWMTINISLTTTANPLLMFRMTPNGNHMLRLLTHS